MSEQTRYVWRKRFGAMSVDEAKRLKALETAPAAGDGTQPGMGL